MNVDRSALVQPLTALEASVRQRADTDHRLLNWWLYFFIVSWLTAGIASIYFFVKRMSRIDKYSRRKDAYYRALIDWTDRLAATSDRRAEVEPTIRDMRALHERAVQHDLKPINALMTFVITLVTAGIYGIFAHYMVNRAWHDRQNVERDFHDLLSRAWIPLGVTSYPIVFEPAGGKDRSFLVWFILTIVTFGIWGLVWDYRLHTDPENVYPRVHQVEDTVVQLARARG